ncbi:hypothetical protein NADE_001611 [Nannochloris sp. 'desiccata']|nr:hypothetical protein KSW81_001532 [Chlorella desiccata (nom. nud.)]KAH7616803.1 hypothetical protein NADE_001611 [Chlorella desiccata (nom. nud.)]
MGPLTLGFRRVLNCSRDVFHASAALQTRKLSIAASLRDKSDQNPTPSRDIYPPNSDTLPRRDPDLYPQMPPSQSPPSRPSDDLPMPDSDPIKRDINPDINPSDMPGM